MSGKQYQFFSTIAKELNIPFKGFDLVSYTIKNGKVYTVSSNPNDYKLSFFTKQYDDNEYLPIRSNIQWIRNTVHLLKHQIKIKDNHIQKKQQEVEKAEETIKVNGKHIKSIQLIGNSKSIIEFDGKTKEEIDEKDKIMAILLKLANQISYEINDTIAAIHAKLMSECINVDRDSDRLVIWRNGEMFEIKGQIKAKEIKEFLFLLTNQWATNPAIKKAVKVSLSDSGYVLTYANEKYTFSKENGELTQLEKELTEDLKQIVVMQ